MSLDDVTYALTVRQPWADLIVAGVKDVENRSWRPPSTLPQWNKCPVTRIVGHERNQETPCGACVPDGPFPFTIAIHAAANRAIAGTAAAWDALGETMGTDGLMARIRVEDRKRLGAIVGTVTVTGCHHADECEDTDLVSFHPLTYQASYCSRWAEPGVWHWTLTDAQPLDTPVPAKGRIGALEAHGGGAVSDVLECQYRRCPGVAEVQAGGFDADGTPVRLGTCDRCGRVTSEALPVEQDALPGLDGGA